MKTFIFKPCQPNKTLIRLACVAGVRRGSKRSAGGFDMGGPPLGLSHRLPKYKVNLSDFYTRTVNT